MPQCASCCKVHLYLRSVLGLKPGGAGQLVQQATIACQTAKACESVHDTRLYGRFVGRRAASNARPTRRSRLLWHSAVHWTPLQRLSDLWSSRPELHGSEELQHLRDTCTLLSKYVLQAAHGFCCVLWLFIQVQLQCWCCMC